MASKNASSDPAAENGSQSDLTVPVSAPRDLAAIIADAAAEYGVDRDIIAGIIRVESGGDRSAQSSSSSARGLMQLTRAAASDVGADYNALFDPETNVRAGAAYLALLRSRYGFNDADMVRAYYAGPGNILKEKRGDTSDPVLRQADAYVDKVIVSA
jgi:soluble lytic murein transglycosylase-like protein